MANYALTRSFSLPLLPPVFFETFPFFQLRASERANERERECGKRDISRVELDMLNAINVTSAAKRPPTKVAVSLRRQFCRARFAVFAACRFADRGASPTMITSATMRVQRRTRRMRDNVRAMSSSSFSASSSSSRPSDRPPPANPPPPLTPPLLADNKFILLTQWRDTVCAHVAVAPRHAMLSRWPRSRPQFPRGGNAR